VGLAEAWAALRRGDAEGCLRLLATVDDPDPRAVGRAHAWRAQALRELGRVEEAEREIFAAIRVAKSIGDTEGVASLRPLQQSILASAAAIATAQRQRAEDRARLDRPLEALGDEDRLRKAALLVDDGQIEAARTTLAHVEGTDARTRVLVLLTAARFDDPEGKIRAAHEIADAADDQNLITAVAQAARAAAVSLAPPSFG
jgi:hypothetical protein